MKERSHEIKMESIIDMAALYSGMARVFEKGSMDKIRNEIGKRINEFFNLKSKEEYIKKHEEFCNWFIKNVKVARRKDEKEGKNKSTYASWGQAAKVMDMVMKVIFYYCKLPSEEYASKIMPWLNGAIDGKILNYLKKQLKGGHLKKYREEYYPKISNIYGIKDIGKHEYKLLQDLLNLDCKETGNGDMLLIQYEDFIWRKLRREEEKRRRYGNIYF